MGVSLWAVDSIIRRFIPLFVQQTGADQGLGHAVRVAVGGRTAVFEVPLLLLAHAARNADAGAAVGHTSGEFVDVRGLVVAGEAASVVQPAFGVVGTDMVTVPLAKLLNAVLNSPETTTQKGEIEYTVPSATLQVRCIRSADSHFNPPSSLISFVLKFVWQPAPFQFPGIGLGSNEATTPKSSQTRCSRKRATHRWSPMFIPSQGPTWNSHWKTTTINWGRCFQLQLVRKHRPAIGFSLQLLLPEQAWLLHWFHKSGLQRKDRLYSEPPQYLYHRPYQLRHRSSTGL